MLTRSGRARPGALELYYEDLGDERSPPVLLVMGLGAQLPMWPDGFCAQLVDAGYRVIRFDHRDTGLSAKMHGSHDPMLRLPNGRAVAAAVPGARFVVVDGMGHDLPRPVWRPILEALRENFARHT